MNIFRKSNPIWASGLEKEINITCGFYASIQKKKGAQYQLKLTASSFYRLFINGNFYYYGPARTAHGYYRVDELDLTEQLVNGINHLAIEVVGYNVNSFYSLDQPSFLQAELFEDGNTVLATGEKSDFVGFVLKQRRRKMQRFSFQRAIAESYILTPSVDKWRCGDFSNEIQATLTCTEKKRTIPRKIPLNSFPSLSPNREIACGKVRSGVIPTAYIKDRSLVHISPLLKGFPEDELEIHLSDEVQEFSYFDRTERNTPYSGKTTLAENTFEILSLVGERTGFIGMDITCHKGGTFYIMMAEKLDANRDVPPISVDCIHAIRFDVAPGQYHFLSFESYSFQVLKLVCTTGEFTINGLHLREYRYPAPITASYQGNRPKLAAICDASVESFCQNAPDIFTDCPSRERAGWLCDSFFIGRMEHFFTGQSIMERCFLENFLLAEKFDCIPEGMLPCAYPADFYDGLFIPNWSLWFVVQLKDHLDRTGDLAFVSQFKEKLYALLRYFSDFENEYGLLESLRGWVLVEHSDTNKFLQDVNYPSNMLYSAVLRIIGELYNDSVLTEKADKLIDLIRSRSYDGQFFTDNEVRQEDGLHSTGARTETCQYYAFFFGIATPETYPELWKTLVEEFGPNRMEKGIYPDIYPSNAFMGNYLRLDLLTQYGFKEQCLEEIEGYFYDMAEQTGTLWEHMTDLASCNHGFASYAAYLIGKNS